MTNHPNSLPEVPASFQWDDYGAPELRAVQHEVRDALLGQGKPMRLVDVRWALAEASWRSFVADRRFADLLINLGFVVFAYTPQPENWIVAMPNPAWLPLPVNTRSDAPKGYIDALIQIVGTEPNALVFVPLYGPSAGTRFAMPVSWSRYEPNTGEFALPQFEGKAKAASTFFLVHRVHVARFCRDEAVAHGIV